MRLLEIEDIGCYCPTAYLLIVLSVLHHFWGQVVESPTHRGSPGRRSVHGPAEVCDLDVSLHTHQKILRLDVSVDDLLAVAVGQGICKLRYVLQQQRNYTFTYKFISACEIQHTVLILIYHLVSKWWYALLPVTYRELLIDQPRN